MFKLSKQWQIRLFFWLAIILLYIFMPAPFNFMGFNIFLAYLPIEIGFQLPRFNDLRALAFWCTLILWLIFYPNTPYVITDLFHLSWLNPHTSVTGILKSDPHIWLIFAIMFICALSSLLFGLLSLDQASHQLTVLTTPQHPKMKFFWVIIFSVIASVGIYIGRFLRLHSIYLFFTPTWFFRQLTVLARPSALKFILIFTVLQILAYWILKTIQNTTYKE
ncbi:DUF1361 domain-containing protein [Lactobacillaceae bacterium 24-114]